MAPRPRRWRIRTLMIVVAIVAGVCWLGREVASGGALSFAALLAISVLAPLILAAAVLALLGLCAAVGTLGLMIWEACKRGFRGRGRGARVGR